MKLLVGPECKHFGINFVHENRFAVATKCKMCMYFMVSPYYLKQLEDAYNSTTTTKTTTGTKIIVITIIIQLCNNSKNTITQFCVPQ